MRVLNVILNALLLSAAGSAAAGASPHHFTAPWTRGGGLESRADDEVDEEARRAPNRRPRARSSKLNKLLRKILRRGLAGRASMGDPCKMDPGFQQRCALKQSNVACLTKKLEDLEKTIETCLKQISEKEADGHKIQAGMYRKELGNRWKAKVTLDKLIADAMKSKKTSVQQPGDEAVDLGCEPPPGSTKGVTRCQGSNPVIVKNCKKELETLTTRAKLCEGEMSKLMEECLDYDIELDETKAYLNKQELKDLEAKKNTCNLKSKEKTVQYNSIKKDIDKYKASVLKMDKAVADEKMKTLYFMRNGK